MARHETLTLADKTWTQLTNADVEAITFQNQADDDLYVVVQSGSTTPTSLDGALVYPPKFGEAQRLLRDLAPGVTTPNRIFAYLVKESGSSGPAEVFVSHA